MIILVIKKGCQNIVSIGESSPKFLKFECKIRTDYRDLYQSHLYYSSIIINRIVLLTKSENPRKNIFNIDSTFSMNFL